MTQTKVEHIKSSRKFHVCSWCFTPINAGEPYDRWRWFGDDGPSTVKVHPECLTAINECIAEEIGPFEWTPGENPRGCNCGFSRGCDRCIDRENQLTRT